MANVHGSLRQAVRFYMAHPDIMDTPGAGAFFFKAWFDGNVVDDWPEYYAWLDSEENHSLEPYHFDPASVAIGFSSALMVFIIVLYAVHWPHP